LKKIAIIPARGGSKRIPKKNIKEFVGKPIIAYSIEAAITSELFDKVIVSTDAKEIAECAIKYGAEVPFLRPKELSDDYTGTIEVIKHCLSWLKKNGYSAKYACCIYATAPLLKPTYLREGLKLLENSEGSYSFSVVPFDAPIQRALRINPDNEIEMIWPENENRRSQDLEETYYDAGQFYWGSSSAFLEGKPIFTTASSPVVVPRHLAQDIDTMEDWLLAENLYRQNNRL